VDAPSPVPDLPGDAVLRQQPQPAHVAPLGGATGHPIMRSVEPDEDWVWCQVDEANIRETDGQWTTYDFFVESGRWFLGRHRAAGGDLDVDPEATSP